MWTCVLKYNSTSIRSKNLCTQIGVKNYLNEVVLFPLLSKCQTMNQLDS